MPLNDVGPEAPPPPALLVATNRTRSDFHSPEIRSVALVWRNLSTPTNPPLGVYPSGGWDQCDSCDSIPAGNATVETS